MRPNSHGPHQPRNATPERLLVVDHFSRKVMGWAVYRKEPTAQEVSEMLDRAVAKAGRAPNMRSVTRVHSLEPTTWFGANDAESSHASVPSANTEASLWLSVSSER
jgi:transposase InsO family protein